MKKAKAKKVQVKLAAVKKEYCKAVSAFAFGDYAYHNGAYPSNADKYTVTHIPTGKAIANINYREARELTYRLFLLPIKIVGTDANSEGNKKYKKAVKKVFDQLKNREPILKNAR